MTWKRSVFLGLIGLKLVIFLFIFLIALQLMILSFKLLNASIVEQIIIATSNPFISLFIGLLITALIHSSSTTTTTIVAIVASGTLTLENAVFMVMGANIGTTVTSTMISIGHITRKKEFRKAVIAATVHDFFNIFTALLLFPLEYYFGFLSNAARWVAQAISLTGSYGIPNPFAPLMTLIEPIAQYIIYLLTHNTILSLALALGLLFASIRFISFLFKEAIFDKSDGIVEKYIFRSPFQSLLFGTILTGIIQSSTLVTSLIVPIVANNKLSMRKAFPIIMGANIGTTFTAFLAAISSSEAAISIAMCHVLFNVIGVLVFFPFPIVRNIPVRMARFLGRTSMKNRLVGFLYILFTFFLIPFVLIYMSKSNIRVKQIKQFELTSIPKIKFPKLNDFIDEANLTNPKQLFYKNSNLNEAWIHYWNKQNQMIVYTQSDSLFFNQEMYALKSEGDCWKGKDELGTFEICVEKVVQNYQLNEHLLFEKCYIFQKKYSNTSYHNQAYRIYIAPQEKLILKYEVVNAQNKVTDLIELIHIID